MIPIVLDASVALSWCFDDERDAFSLAVRERVTSSGGHVSAVFTFEVVNGLIIGERRNRIVAGDAFRYVRAVFSLPLLADTETDWEAVIRIAREAGLTAYDASYLELAQRLHVPLATRDRRLRAAADDLGIRTIIE